MLRYIFIMPWVLNWCFHLMILQSMCVVSSSYRPPVHSRLFNLQAPNVLSGFQHKDLTTSFKPTDQHTSRLNRVNHNDELKNYAPVEISCEIDGKPTVAMIDTGAELSVVSSKWAERYQLTSLIDKSYAGRAIGVGNGQILGRLADMSIRIGPIKFSSSLSVLKNSRVDMIIGLDVLRRFRGDISLLDDTLRLHVEKRKYKIPFIRNIFTTHTDNDIYDTHESSTLVDSMHSGESGGGRNSQHTASDSGDSKNLQSSPSFVREHSYDSSISAPKRFTNQNNFYLYTAKINKKKDKIADLAVTKDSAEQSFETNNVVRIQAAASKSVAADEELLSLEGI